MTLVEGIGHNQRHGYRQRTEHLDVVFEILNRYADHNTSCTYWGWSKLLESENQCKWCCICSVKSLWITKQWSPVGVDINVFNSLQYFDT